MPQIFRGVLTSRLLILTCTILICNKFQSVLSQCTTTHQTLICRNILPTQADLSHHSKLKIVNLTDAHLSVRKPIMAKIVDIEVFQCNLKTIDPEYFANIGGRGVLRMLKLRDINGSAIIDRNVLRGLEGTLTILLIFGTSGNPIHVDLSVLSSLQHLRELTIHGTTVSPLAVDFKSNLPQLDLISMEKTNLTVMPWRELTDWLKEKSSRSLALGAGDWHCDKQILALQELDNLTKLKLSAMRCATPEALASRLVLQLNSKELPHLSDEKPTSSPAEAKDKTKPVSTNLVRGGIHKELLLVIVCVAVLILLFVIILIACKICRSRRKKRSRIPNSRVHKHESAKYCAVIETPTNENRPKSQERSPNNYGHDDAYTVRPDNNSAYIKGQNSAGHPV